MPFLLPHETVQGQTFIADIELTVDLGPAGRTDNLDLSIDYSLVYQSVKEIVEGSAYKLIEAVAENIAGALLEAYPVDKVKVRLNKPQAPVNGRFDAFAVEIERTR